MAHGQFDVRVETNRKDEIGHLGEALNQMAAQLKGFVYGQKRFLGDIAHELSAPLARSQMAMELLSRQTSSGYAESVKEEVQHMSELVNELLHFSKAGLKASQSPAAAVCVGELAARVIQREAREGVHVEMSAGKDLSVLAQPDGLERALGNLVRNAVTHAGQDGPITVSAERHGSHVTITVADQGPGLPEDALDRIFEPFYRPDSSRSRASGGVGLGLAIVKSCVESSKGTISCRNRKPKGLEVMIRLPAA